MRRATTSIGGHDTASTTKLDKLTAAICCASARRCAAALRRWRAALASAPRRAANEGNTARCFASHASSPSALGCCRFGSLSKQAENPCRGTRSSAQVRLTPEIADADEEVPLAAKTRMGDRHRAHRASSPLGAGACFGGMVVTAACTATQHHILAKTRSEARWQQSGRLGLGNAGFHEQSRLSTAGKAAAQHVAEEQPTACLDWGGLWSGAGLQPLNMFLKRGQCMVLILPCTISRAPAMATPSD